MNVKYISNASLSYYSLTVMSSFLLISLNIGAILGEVTLHQRRKKLDKVIEGGSLGEAYSVTISRIKAQQRSMSKLGMEVLMWVSHSERPLHVDELCHALGVEEGSTYLNIRNIPAIETLLACSLGLVTVEKSSSTIRLVHYTLQEYLFYNSHLFIKPHSAIAEVCLTYLNFPHIRSFSPALRSIPPTAPFVEYASCHWGAHARRETTESVKTLALKVLDGYDRHISSKMLLLRGMSFWDRPLDLEDCPTRFTGLHGAAYLGCGEITVALLEMNKWDVQATDLKGNTAISWAARRGHEGVVKILVEQGGINPDAPDEYGRTPFLLAAENGHEGVVKILLERDVNPNTADIQFGRTPLSFAAGNGHEGVVRVLLERDDVDLGAAHPRLGWTPLSWAARNGHEGVVRILLGRSDLNPDKPDKSGRTPLSLAAENGREGVVRALLERGNVNPEAADIQFGRTPLSFAAGNGFGGVVRILLERNVVNPNTPDGSGRTPLSFAAGNGHEGVVRILRERNTVNPNTPDNFGRTPLSLASAIGHERVMRALLERNDANPNTPDQRCQSNLQPTEKFSPEPPELSKPPSKRARMF